MEENMKNTQTAAPKKKSIFGGEWFFGLSGRSSFLLSLAIVLVICFLDNFTPDKVISNFTKYIIVCGFIYAIATLGINFYSGYLGETSLGHAAFFGIGAYATAYMSTTMEVPFWLTIPVGMVLSAIASLPMSWAGRRVKGSFMVVITYGFSEVLRYVAINSKALGGTAGIPSIPTPTIMGTKITKLDIFPSNKDAYILILFFIVAFLAFFTWRVVHSRVGYAINSIREDAIAAEAMGINVKAYKTWAIMISAIFCSIAGSFYAAFSNTVAPDLLGATLSIQIFTMLVVGGRRSIKGSILGAFIIMILPEILRGVQEVAHLSFDPWYILYGLMLIIMMRFRPEGLFGAKED